MILCVMCVVSSGSSWFLSETVQKPLDDTVHEEEADESNDEEKRIYNKPGNLVHKIGTFLDTAVWVNPWGTRVNSLENNTNKAFIPPGTIFIIQQGGGEDGEKLKKGRSINLTDIPTL